MNKKPITIKEAAIKTGCKKSKIYRAIQCRQLTKYGKEKILVLEDDLFDWLENRKRTKITRSPFDNIALDFDESLKIIDGINNPNNMLHPGKYVTKDKYAISNHGRLFNLSTNREYKPSISTHGYLQVKLDEIVERVHVLVATFWCANAKLKTQVHHINGNKKDNRSVNLIWMWDDEHHYAEKLLKEAKITNNFKAYKKYISKVQRDNEWNNEYRGLVFDKGTGAIFVWIPKELHELYVLGKIGLSEITNDKALGGLYVPNKKEKE